MREMDSCHKHLFESVYMLLLSGNGDGKAACDPSYYHFSMDAFSEKPTFENILGHQI